MKRTSSQAIEGGDVSLYVSSSEPSSVQQMSPANQQESSKRRCDHGPPSLRNGVSSTEQGQLPQQPITFAQGRVYGTTTIDGNAQVQLGDSYHYYVGGSQMAGSTSLADLPINDDTHMVYQQHLLQPPMYEDPVVALKRALYYQGMEKRRSQLDQVDPASFDWIWTETSFPAWLEGNSGLYWISGKPASGKSTLINYLVSNGSEAVRSRLAVSGTDPLLVHFFFDFRAGSSIPNSPVGLLRSLLLQLSSKSVAIERYIIKTCGYRLQGVWPDLEKELLDLVCESAKEEPRTICGLIDGLDEYTGSLLKLADLIILLQRRSGIRLCLASRPHPELRHRLGNASFLMQGHNDATIRAYAHSALMELEIHFSQEDLLYTLARIESDAEGVILWARLAVDEVVCAVLRGESLRSASTRLDDFPSELEQVYQRILDSLDANQMLQAAVVFFILEFWNSSWGGHVSEDHSLRANRMAILYSSVLGKLDETQAADFRHDGDTPRFCLKMRSMLKGLVMFPESFPCRPTLMHKTVKSFLHFSQDYALLKERIIKLADPDILGPAFMCQNLLSADESFDNNAKPSPCSDEALRGFFNDNPLEGKWNLPAIAPWFLAATQTKLWRQWERDRFQYGLNVWWERDVRWHNQQTKKKFPEIFCFIYRRYDVVFDLALLHDTYVLAEEEKESLRKCYKGFKY